LIKKTPEEPVVRLRISLAAAALTIGTMLSIAPGYAQDDLRRRGDRACKNDAPRLCKHAFPGGDMAILACFQQNKARLTASCRKFLTEIGQLPPG
jgi:hypothetical protein